METDASALHLVLTGDPALYAIVVLSLLVSLSALVFAAIIGIPLGAALALVRFTGREAVIVVLNALMGLPPVVIGLKPLPLNPAAVMERPSAHPAAPRCYRNKGWLLIGWPVVRSDRSFTAWPFMILHERTRGLGQTRGSALDEPASPNHPAPREHRAK